MMATLVASTVLTLGITSGTAQTTTLAPPRVEMSAFAVCVAERESHNNPAAVSASGKHRGKYQFTPELARGATWMMLPWLASWHPQPGKYSAQLRALPMNRWPERVQDAAFRIVSRWDANNWRHWYLNGSHCNALGKAAR